MRDGIANFTWISIFGDGFAGLILVHIVDKLKSVNGTFGSVGGSNEWAAFHSTYTPIIFAVIPVIKNKIIRILCWFLAIANILVLLFSFSRGAYVGIIASLLWFILLKKKDFMDSYFYRFPNILFTDITQIGS